MWTMLRTVLRLLWTTLRACGQNMKSKKRFSHSDPHCRPQQAAHFDHKDREQQIDIINKNYKNKNQFKYTQIAYIFNYTQVTDK